MAVLAISDQVFDQAVVEFSEELDEHNSSGLNKSYLILFQGTVPTEIDVFNAFSGFRISDVLIKFFTFNKIAQDVTDPKSLRIAPTGGTVEQSGTATWFMIVDNYSTTFPIMLVGTISDFVGSGELKLANPNLISGNTLFAGEIFISIPQDFA